MIHKPDIMKVNRRNGIATLLWLSEENSCGEAEIIASLKIDIEDCSFAEFKDHKTREVEDITNIEVDY